ncbi:multifunctional procollagen lysine hydroxylase and glycosyltransferase LH3-like [Corticium candelabrum]|uniref:multifunctional procollagen lysine hydroxylase and glycosyltransferase LH3-like n=1 Tax=Corticium candelabrum TaxID=121492 RepID=UPI002E276363|nr:multifunctional procollagen lysine hydroxylase and glycosyltransferase LH3-like [Corticium candelabrum]
MSQRRYLMCWITSTFLLVVSSLLQEGDTNLLVMTVATELSDGHARFMESVEQLGLDVKVVGMEQGHRSALTRQISGRKKISLLVNALAQYKDNNKLVVMITDSKDAILLAGKEAILSKFRNFDSSLVFAADKTCSPDEFLAENYPNVFLGSRFISSGGYIGYASVVYEALSTAPIRSNEHEQLFFTHLYLYNKEFKKKYNVKLDHRAHLFQNLNGAEEEVELMFDGSHSWIENVVYNTKPVMIRGTESSRLKLNYLGNYVPNRWLPDSGCSLCDQNTFSLQDKADTEFPDVLIAIFSITPTPFFKRFLERVAALNYPKSRISLRFYVLNKFHHIDAMLWLDEPSNAAYRNVSFISHESHLTESEAREDGVRSCVMSSCSYYFAIDTTAMLVNRNTLRLLVEQNRTLLAPLVAIPKKLFSNFWGSLLSTGYYARSPDYIDIITRRKVGIWNVPYVMAVYLIKGSVLSQRFTLPYTASGVDVDMAFCASLRKLEVFMYVTNRHHFGHLVESSRFTTTRYHNDMYQLFDNKLDWEEEYIHPNYSQCIEGSTQPPMPCPDVYDCPLFSPKFARELIEEMERYGQWLPTKEENEDIPFYADQESFQTVEIAMDKIAFNSQWMEIIKSYILPMQQQVYNGYNSHGRSDRNVVVKYRKQSSFALKPHGAKSGFIVNVALSQHGRDYQGGGYRFVRYNCTTTRLSIGHILMYPGQITHWYERLGITAGANYVIISVIAP